MGLIQGLRFLILVPSGEAFYKCFMLFILISQDVDEQFMAFPPQYILVNYLLSSPDSSKAHIFVLG